MTNSCYKNVFLHYFYAHAAIVSCCNPFKQIFVYGVGVQFRPWLSECPYVCVSFAHVFRLLVKSHSNLSGWLHILNLISILRSKHYTVHVYSFYVLYTYVYICYIPTYSYTSFFPSFNPSFFHLFFYHQK